MPKETNRPIEDLLNAERPDLRAAATRLRCLDELADFTYASRPFLDHLQKLVDELLADPPPAGSTRGSLKPWFSPTPAVYLAALLLHVGLPKVATLDGGIPPHATESASTAREVLREAGCPFEVREHAVALVSNRRKPASLLGSGALAETYMELACALDLRTLYYLARAEARVAGDDEEASRMQAFRRHVEGLGVFTGPPSPPLPEEQVQELGYEDQRRRHRALNALRYFRLVARMTEHDWFAERLRQEQDRPNCRLHLLVGPAGCGKSSWALDHLDHTEIISSDRMRRELTGDPADQSQNYLVFQRCMDRAREQLQRGREVTFDATNYCRKLRKMPLQAARWSGAEIVSYFFDVGLREALARNRKRERMVPEDVIRRHHRLLEPPALFEADRHLLVGPEGATRLYWPVQSAGPEQD